MTTVCLCAAVWLTIWYALQGWPLVSMLWALSAALQIAVLGDEQ